MWNLAACSRWDAWVRFMQRVLSSKPLIHNKGNHEVEELTLDSWNTFKGANARFPSPQVRGVSGLHAVGCVSISVQH